MTKKIISWLACMTVFLSFWSCRQESLLQDNDFYNNQSKYRVYTLNKQQVKNDFFLFDKVAGIQSKISGKAEKSFGKNTGKSIQDSLLTDAVIGINKVLVVENNGEKTYTFALKRNYPSSKTENLVLKKNPDSTFTGKLIQYNVTLKEKELFNAWHSIDLKDRVKVYNIENLNIPSSAGRIGSVSFGCFTVLYEDGTCSGEEHHAYGDSSCPLIGTSQQAGAPRILSITEIPSCGGGGNSGSTGGSNPTQPGGGGGDNGLTIIFDDIDLNYYSSDNMTDPDFVFWSQVNQFVQAQPQVVRNFNSEYHFVYYYIHAYFKNNGGLTQANKNFVSQRLFALSTWYFDLTKASYLNTDQRLSLTIWSEKYLLENPDVSWDEFESSFLISPCEKIKKSTNDPKYKSNISNLEGKTGLDHEEGYRLGTPISGSGQTGTQNQLLQNLPGTHEVDMKIFSNTFALMHTHYDGIYPIFSPGDIVLFNNWIVWANTWNAVPTNTPKIPINNLTLTVVTSNGNYLLAFDGSVVDPLPAYTQEQFDDLNDKYKTKYLDNANNNGNFNVERLEKEFLKFINERMNMTGLKLYRVKSDGNYEISLSNLNGVKCP